MCVDGRNDDITDTSPPPYVENGSTSDIQRSENSPLLPQTEETWTWKDEARPFVNLAWRMASTSGLSLAMTLTDTIFIGHVGSTLAFESGSFALTIANLVIIPFTRYMTGATTVSIAQSYGYKNHALSWEWVQLGLVSAVILSVIPMIPLLYPKRILGILTTDASIIDEAASFSRVCVAWVAPTLLNAVLGGYLKGMGMLWPVLFIYLFWAIMNIAFNYLLIFGVSQRWKGLGLRGSAVATALSRGCITVTLALYITIMRFKAHRRNDPLDPLAHGTLQWTALNPTRAYRFLIIQGLPMLVTAMMEEAQFFLINIWVSYISPEALTAQNAVLQIILLFTCINFGFLTATSVRVGHVLGTGHPERGWGVFRMALIFSACTSSVVGATLVASRNYVGRIFTSDPKIIHQCSKALVVVGPAYVCLSVFYTCIGMLEGQSRAVMITIPLVIGSCISVPASWALGTHTNLELTGIWLGVSCGYAFITVCLLVGVLKSDWGVIAKRASLRSEMKYKAAATTEVSL